MINQRKLLLLSLTLLLSVSFVSAAWIETDFGWKWFTGNVVACVDEGYGPIGATRYTDFQVGLGSYFNNQTLIYINSINSSGDVSVTVNTISDGISCGQTKYINGLKIQVINSSICNIYPKTSNAFRSSILMVAACSFTPQISECTHSLSECVAPSIVKPIENVTQPIGNIAYLFIQIVGSNLKAQQVTLTIGQSITIGGKTIVLNNIDSSGTVLISVDEILDAIGVSNSKIMNGIEIANNGGPFFEEPIVETPPETCPSPLKIGEVQIWNKLNVGSCLGLSGANVCLKYIDPSETALLSVDGLLDNITNSEKKRIGNITVIAYLPTNESKPWNYITLTTWSCLVGTPVTIQPQPQEVITPIVPTQITPLQQCNGCLIDSTCLPFGTRQKGLYCSINKTFEPQLELKEACENSYECRSNECSDGKCISTAGLLQRLLDLLSRIFGGKGQ